MYYYLCFMEDGHIKKSHNKTLLLYHIVLPLKYRRSVITESIGSGLRDICLSISERYEINFLEIGYEPDHVHFLVQSVPMLSVSEVVTIIKSFTARELYRLYPEIKEQLWGGNFWTSGYYVNTVGQYGSKEVILRYIESQGIGNSYKKVHDGQLSLFEF